MLIRALSPVRLATAAAVALALPLSLGSVAPATAATPSATADAAPAAYTFTIIADSADGLDPFEFGCAALNNAGQVAFHAVDSNGVEAIYRGDGAALTTIVRDKPHAYDSLTHNPSINDAGQVSLVAELKGPGERILRGDGTTLDTVADSTVSDFATFGFETSINEAGRVAFKATLDDDDRGLFSATASGAAKTYYLASKTEFTGNQSGPSIRGSKVAYFDILDGDLTYGVFLAHGSATDTVIDTSGPYGTFDSPSLGRRGRVAVHAFDDEGINDFIITARNGAAKIIADDSGRLGSFGTASINAHGTVAYEASVGFASATGMYEGKSETPILEVGDALDGSTVANVAGCTEALNDSGQVAFVANLDDGRTLVVRADPA